MEYKVQGKELIYEKVSPDNIEQIEEASHQEKEGIGRGVDPVEIVPVLQYISRKGIIWLQYIYEKSGKKATGVIEFIPLTKALQFNPGKIEAKPEDLELSPFAVVMADQKRIFEGARRFTRDDEIIYHHGISMERRGQGYGTLLMAHALKTMPALSDKAVVCFIDAAAWTPEGLQLLPNEDSITLHLKAGFYLAGVVSPPVYDEKITYYLFVKWKGIHVDLAHKGFPVNLAEGNAQQVLNKIAIMTSKGVLGINYSKTTHEMFFSQT